MKLVARGVTHSYGALTVLDDVSLHAGAGEIVAVVGPSGCGKSTLLRILGGLERAGGGEALLEGEAPAGALVPVTFVFQDFALLPWRTVEGNVRLPLEAHGLSRAEISAIVADALARTGLTDFAQAWPRQLSGGMRQRVGIARALAVRPAVLLMDEPLSALDAQTRELLIDDLVALHAGGDLATIYVTHNLDEAARLADRIVVLSRRPGRVREVIEVPAPREERARPEAAGEVAALATRVWSLIRADAAAADRELLEAGHG
jgi:NitT/TauT family transport system ATP-binding protein